MDVYQLTGASDELLEFFADDAQKRLDKEAKKKKKHDASKGDILPDIALVRSAISESRCALPSSIPPEFAQNFEMLMGAAMSGAAAPQCLFPYRGVKYSNISGVPAFLGRSDMTSSEVTSFINSMWYLYSLGRRYTELRIILPLLPAGSIHYRDIKRVNQPVDGSDPHISISHNVMYFLYRGCQRYVHKNDQSTFREGAVIRASCEKALKDVRAELEKSFKYINTSYGLAITFEYINTVFYAVYKDAFLHNCAENLLAKDDHNILSSDNILCISKNESLFIQMCCSIGVPYKYEDTLVCSNVAYRPDFTISPLFCCNTKIYIELFGNLTHSDPSIRSNYVSRSMNKLNAYKMNGISCGKNLICFFFTSGKGGNFKRMKEVLMMACAGFIPAEPVLL